MDSEVKNMIASQNKWNVQLKTLYLLLSSCCHKGKGCLVVLIAMPTYFLTDSKANFSDILIQMLP